MMKTAIIVVLTVCFTFSLYAQLIIRNSNNEEVMRVTQNKIVGIGTTAPDNSAKIDIAGKTKTNNIQITGGNPSQGKLLVANDSNGEATWAYQGFSRRACRIYLYGPEVGINTTAPHQVVKASLTNVDWEKKESTENSMFDTINGCIVIPITGYYMATATIAAKNIQTNGYLCSYILKANSVSELTNLNNIVEQGSVTHNLLAEEKPTSSQATAFFYANQGEYVAAGFNSSDTQYTLVNIVQRAHNCMTIIFLGY